MSVRTVREILEASTSLWSNRWGDAARRKAPVYLTLCGTTDITQPYHSHSYLAGALNRSGHSYAVRDLAIEFWHYVMSPEVMAELRRECLRQMDTERGEQVRLLRLFADLLENSERFRSAFQALRDPQSFHHLPSYLAAIRELSMLPRLLTLLSRKAIYRTFSSASPPGSEEDRINLVTLRSEVEAGFGVEVLDYYYDYHADQIAALQPGFVGMSIPFISQLEHSLMLGHRLRKRGVKVAIGGPIAAKFYKYIDDVEKLDILSFGVDSLITGEGETLVCQLADQAQNGANIGRPDNFVDLHDPKPLERYFFENVEELPSPDYSLWDYSLYGSPEPGGLYSPTRGCYWNKCSFCDYGLAMNAPTSPWRTRSPAKVVEDLTAAAPYVKYFFFAVDVLSPSYALKVSRELIERNVKVKWMADFRLESTFKLENVKVFAEAGCLGAAFGMESTDQEVIDLINKGTRVNRLEYLVNSFADAGIPVQLMGFTGHPGETRRQAQTTFDTARTLLKSAATVALGKFGLTPGADIAKRPERYGIDVHYDPSGDTAIPWEIRWTHRRPVDVYPEDDYRESLRLVRGFPYPFLGATSTLHSLLYFERRPKAPFPIPQWGYELSWGRFHVIPFFIQKPEGDEVTVQSGLTGRVLLLPPAEAQTLERLFPKMAWLRIDATKGVSQGVRDLLDFLVEHSLAMFIPEESV
ncbi:hypothetical protein D187_001260 [Cystobacter fuscus DSM 2262]|uniref:Elp3/MiaA/NifB-like radical SAM core domain-containing protein n=1 Tax=Cystobacter fuscus (strain ATCC 25194 / DSM 2262 / NBRC 100088 / M29) TaxID=1242864 RepID=S9PGE8_CYSF2|nr:hypothetical protein D187_001260 [Cystobacter fuscus DSM 2262]